MAAAVTVVFCCFTVRFEKLGQRKLEKKKLTTKREKIRKSAGKKKINGQTSKNLTVNSFRQHKMIS
jgi:hypothetical protein